MQTMQLLVFLSLWYVPGALAARAMARRGHDPLPWVYLAWITGAVTVVVALVYLAYQRTQPIPTPTRSTPEPDRMIPS